MTDVLVSGIKISEMDLVNEITGSEKIPTDQAGDKAINVNQILSYVNSNIKPVWGNIQGDINKQVDLINLINTKFVYLDDKIDHNYNDLQTQINSLGGGASFGYKSYAIMVADASNIPPKSIVTVGGDPDPTKDGQYIYDGTTFLKSPYDPLQQAKNYADANPRFKVVDISTGIDFNSKKTGGEYDLTTNAFTESTNKPPTDVGGLLIVYGKNSNYLCSQEYRSSKNEVFFRYLTDTWSAWITFTKMSDFNTVELNSPIDFNLYKDKKQYVINGVNLTASTNKPPVTVGGILQILGNGGNYLTSQVFTTWTNEIYTRSLTDTWSVWKKLAFNSDFDVVSITAGIDFDTYKTQKTYSVTNIAIQASSHAPASTFGGILRVIGTGANYLTQQIYIDYKGVYFYRALEVNWTPWFKLVTSAVTDNLAAQIAAIETPSTGLTGKKWLAVGDSITVGLNATKSYADVLAERYTATLTKHATSGAWISAGTGTITIPNILSQTYTSLPDSANFDLITIAAGTNDRINGTDGNLGVFDDRTTSTFYGALHTLISGLKTKYPNARMLFISQTPSSGLRTNPSTPTDLDKKFKAITEVCDYYAVPVWSGHKNFGFHPDDNTTFKSTYMPDGLHPSDAGHVWYANRLEQVIISNAK